MIKVITKIYLEKIIYIKKNNFDLLNFVVTFIG